ncbi:MATE family efflux transporter [Leptospira sp. GIMC2001]|uniref:MATE family efflux transporter n=1 Tax=Leptospira sp. GIMC2001 TaxID=1513297 RepID=UPI0023493E21|nr:MATE family efflux transporter [Leptospira sp. GIMC2001]WCL49082.1 MATE family efflux transporter [Leptospira sp. GIMC2001]
MNKIASADLYKRFLTLTSLNILSNITVPLTGIVDTAVLGHYTDPISISGVSIGTIMFDYLYWGMGFLRMGTTGTTAIKTGQGDEEGAFLVLIRSLILAACIGCTIYAFSYYIGNFGFGFLMGDDSIKKIGRDYYDHRIWDAPFTLMNFAIIGWLLGRSRSGLVLILTLSSNLLNVGLDYVFVVFYNQGASGVGMATAYSQVFQFCIGLILIFYTQRKYLSILGNHLFSLIFRKLEFYQLLIFNKDIFLRTLFLIVTFTLFRNFSSSLGSDVLIINSILFQFMLVYAFLADGSAFATETLAGDLYGQGKIRELKTILRIAIAFSVAISLIFVATLSLFSNQIIGLLITKIQIIQSVQDVLIWFFPVLILGAYAFSLDGLFLGLAKGSILRNSMAISSFLFFLPCAILALYIESNIVLWISLSLYMGSRAITLYYASRKILCII